eukprot:m.235470 g.235470  ORF g.235470 m.235470 type:complete len:361 (+) comp26533_c1_seq2:165-1247(+)
MSEKNPATPQVRNILAVGETGAGKSSLLNNLARTTFFKEGDSVYSVTRDVTCFQFEENGIHYNFIDTVGIGDTKYTWKEVACKFAEAMSAASGGIFQILVVIKSRLTSHMMEVIKLMQTVLMSTDVVHYTTIVRTHTRAYNDVDWCKQQEEQIRSFKDDEFLRNVRSVQFVDNPSLIDASPAELKRRQDCHLRMWMRLTMCTEKYIPRSLSEMHESIKLEIKNKASIHQKVKDLEAQLTSSAKNQETLVKKLAETKKDSGKLRDDMMQQLAKVDAKRQKLEAERSRLVQKHQESIGKVASELANSLQQTAKAMAEINKLKANQNSSKANYEKQISELKNKIQGLENNSGGGGGGGGGGMC